MADLGRQGGAIGAGPRGQGDAPGPHSHKADQHRGQGSRHQQECEKGGAGIEARPQGTDPTHKAQQQGTIEQAPAIALGQDLKPTGLRGVYKEEERELEDQTPRRDPNHESEQDQIPSLSPQSSKAIFPTPLLNCPLVSYPSLLGSTYLARGVSLGFPN